MEKIMLISGCSHAAGSEINGTEDSLYNRQHSFGNLLAEKLGYRPINISVLGASNMGISRGVLQWFAEQYDPSKHEVFVLMAWAESARIDIPIELPSSYKREDTGDDWFPDTINDYSLVNNGSSSPNDWEDILIKRIVKFIGDNVEYLEVMSATFVLQLQYFLKMMGVKYCMCNTGYMFTKEARHMKFYLGQIDRTHYLNMDSTEFEAFYWKYRKAGYVNKLATYDHHGQEPHVLYAEELYKFITDNGLTNK